MAFITEADKPEGTLIYLGTFDDPTYYLTNTLLSFTGIIGDAVLVRSIIYSIIWKLLIGGFF